MFKTFVFVGLVASGGLDYQPMIGRWAINFGELPTNREIRFALANLNRKMFGQTDRPAIWILINRPRQLIRFLSL